mgnify:FL=1
MTYSVKEIFYTLQGEGGNAGRAAVFCRFSGCNLWSGLEKHRSEAICKFCDTDFVGTDGINGGKYKTFKELCDKIESTWNGQESRLVVLTGGEPGLQVTKELVSELQNRDFEVAIETNGTVPIPSNIDWVCVSPKASTKLLVTKGDELKLVFPQEGVNPNNFIGLDFTHFFLQPLDDANLTKNSQMAVEYCMSHSKWRLSTQTHKILKIP